MYIIVNQNLGPACCQLQLSCTLIQSLANCFNNMLIIMIDRKIDPYSCSMYLYLLLTIQYECVGEVLSKRLHSSTPFQAREDYKLTWLVAIMFKLKSCYMASLISIGLHNYCNIILSLVAIVIIHGAHEESHAEGKPMTNINPVHQ